MTRENRGVAFRTAADQAGFVQLPWVVVTAKRLAAVEVRVYACLLHYARQDDACFPGQGKLCGDLEVSESTIRRSLRELETVGLITTEQRGLGQTNVYWIEPLTDELVRRLADRGYAI